MTAVRPEDYLSCGPTEDPLLCSPEEKPALEARNSAEQLLYIRDLIEQGVTEVRESYVRAFQTIAVADIYPCNGRYVTATNQRKLQGGGVTHVPPEPALVPGCVCDAVDVINERMKSGGDGAAVKAAAYALWRLNWIHPFSGGNGRTARAVAYLVLCIDYGRMIPAAPTRTMPSIISARQGEYVRALREADEADARGREDTRSMERLVGRAIVAQLTSAVHFYEAALRAARARRDEVRYRKHVRNRPSRAR